MDVIDYDKLVQAIELVAYNRLDECRDDTLIEKLISVFDRSFDHVNCSQTQLNAIFDLCKRSIDDWKADKLKVYISPVFSFVFKLISSPDVQATVGRKAICLELSELVDLKTDVFECDYSIQSNYVKGLSKLFANREGSKIVFEEALIDASFVQSLINLALANRSFFVRESIQRCLVELIRRSVEFDDKLTSTYFQLIVSSFELKINKFQIKIINQLLLNDVAKDVGSSVVRSTDIRSNDVNSNDVSSNEIRSTINRLFPDLNQKLINHLNCHADENVIIQLVELLASSLDDETQIDFVFIKLIKNNLIRPLIAYSTNLSSRNPAYLNKWFVYVVLPLDVSRTSTSNQHFNYTEFDQQYVRAFENEKTLIYCLHYLKVNFPLRLTDQQLHQVFEIVGQFVTNSIEQGKIKLLRESLLMIGNLGKRLNQLEPSLFGMLVGLLIDLLWSEHFQSECLIWLRHLFENDFNHRLIGDKDIQTKMTDLIDRLLKLELKDENLDVIDGGLELLDALIKTDHLNLNELDESVLRSIFNIWSYSTEHSDNYSLKASSISILFNLRLQLNSSIIDRLTTDGQPDQTTAQTDIMEIIWKCLKDENSLVRRKVIDTIKERIFHKDQLNGLLDELMKEDGKLYLGICYHVSESILFDIDADIQLAAIHLLKNLLTDLMSKPNLTDSDPTNALKFKGLIYFVHCLHFTLMNNLVYFTVKEECLNAIELLRNCLDQNSISKSRLISILDDCESVFNYQVDGHKEDGPTKSTNGDDLHKRRDEQLNEMFKDNLFRTEEIIAQFTNERVEQMKNCSLHTDSTNHQTSITNKMNSTALVEFLYSFDPKTIPINEIKVDFLDDILSARANDDVVIDCY